MPERSFLSDLLSRVARAAGRGKAQADLDPLALSAELLEERGEAQGLAVALAVLEAYDRLEEAEKTRFLLTLTERFGVDDAALSEAISRWTEGDDLAARAIMEAAEPASQDLIRRFNRVPGATARLVAMRADLLERLGTEPALAGLDRDFRHLFLSWFNRGFLRIARIDWSTSAEVLEKIIAYEAVHEISDWDDLRQRVAAPDRRLFAFFHPVMPTEPLIFVEVALTTDIPDSIAPILARERAPTDPEEATTAVFYSISNCQAGLRGISFGSFLIKQVVEELRRDLPALSRFVTLSPVPGLRRWLASLPEAERPKDTPPEPQELRALCARYLLTASRDNGSALDPVAHFHLGNGARLERIHPGADPGPRGQANSWGVMVNYLYDDKRVEANHRAYRSEGYRAAAADLRALAGLPKK